MARSRNIKPALFKNELLGVEDPLLTILFISLWCLADKSGRLEDRPLRIRAETFPYRENIDINRYLTVLTRLGFIRRYDVDGLKIIQVINFDKHQHPHKTEAESVLPEYIENSNSCSITVKAPLDNGSRPADSLIPDSLIPDSLIPDSLIPDSLIPDENKKINKKEKSNLFFDVTEQTQAEFKKLRSAKKAPITERAITAIRSEAAKAGITLEAALIECCDRGWAGFKAEWYIKSHAPPQSINKADALLEKNRISTQHWRPPEMRQQNEN